MRPHLKRLRRRSNRVSRAPSATSGLRPTMIEVQRLQAGVILAGPRYMIQLTPVNSANMLGSPTVSVSVLARAELTGDDRNVRLEAYDIRHEFRLGDIAVDAREMRCLRVAYERAPLFREGFTLALEEGMAEQLSAYLPRIDLISLVALGVGDGSSRCSAVRRHRTSKW